ncbi:transglutaminase-like cysteine peptidase [Mesorhizobium onobrychidis]|uniref:Transglutaminase-like cysteine peptidase n=1 Tax=Mesorhizobium onobrychidis TaxID=2775404 RepID=A0ABY5QP12_9HYPH|nr:transglutaminase-like cysteine peptidase [Mesorhizobium onobrychidis]UVC12763.1 transglutaminase-like cysteine peptidase [Mesorhizobium onobrychidis]
MLTGDPTTQPIGHYEFCKANPKECAIRTRDLSPVQMSEEFRQRISEINRDVNRSVEPMLDVELFGKGELWTYPGKAGGLRGLRPPEAPCPPRGICHTRSRVEIKA